MNVASFRLKIEINSGIPKVSIVDVKFATSLLESAIGAVAAQFPDDEVIPSINYTRFRAPGARRDRVALASRKNSTALAIFLPSWTTHHIKGFKQFEFKALPRLQGFLVPEADVKRFLGEYVFSKSKWWLNPRPETKADDLMNPPT